MRRQIVCSKCGSENVLKETLAAWSVDKQEWIVHSDFGYVECSHCDAKTYGEEVELEDRCSELDLIKLIAYYEGPLTCEDARTMRDWAEDFLKRREVRLLDKTYNALNCL